MKKLLLTTLIAAASSAYAHDLFIENNSSCALTKIGHVTMPGAVNNAPATIAPHKTGKITVSASKTKDGEDFVDVYIAKCAHDTVNFYVYGGSDLYGWATSLDANNSLTIANASGRDKYEEWFEASYSQNRVVLANK